MKTQIITLILCVFFIGFSTKTVAQDLAAIETEITEPTENEQVVEDEKENKLQVSGFVDAYYQYHFLKSAFPTSFTETHDSFTPSMANVVLSKEGKFGFVADLAVGPRAETANGYNGTTLAVIKQLFVTYAPTEKLNFTFGNFGTHVGYEVIDAPANINYSTSYLFSNGPFFHTGLKLDYAVSENFGFMIGVFNDTDTKIDEVSGKHLGAQVSFTKGNLEAYVNYIGGKDAEGDANEDDVFGHQIDLTTTYQATEKLGFGLNATIKSVVSERVDNENWSGTALYANYVIDDRFTLGFRGEIIDDKDGLILGVEDNLISSLTLSGNVKLGPITLIPEVRLDNSKEVAFLDEHGGLTDKSAAFIFAAVYQF